MSPGEAVQLVDAQPPTEAEPRTDWRIDLPHPPQFQRKKYGKISVHAPLHATVTVGLSSSIRANTKAKTGQGQPTHELNIIAERSDGTRFDCCNECDAFIEAKHSKANNEFQIRVLCGHTGGQKRKVTDDIWLRFQLTVCGSESNNNNNSTVIELGRHKIAFCATRGDAPREKTSKKTKFHHCTFSVTRFLRKFSMALVLSR